MVIEREQVDATGGEPLPDLLLGVEIVGLVAQVKTRVGDELRPLYRQIPAVLVGTGLRPEELYGLEWRDIDLKAGVLSVERVFTQGRLKPCMKSDRQRRRGRQSG